MAALSHSRLSQKASMIHHARSFWWVQSDEEVLVEDLIGAFKTFAWIGQEKRSVMITSPQELIAEIDSGVVGERRLLVVRGAESLFTQRWREAVSLRVEQHLRDSGRLLVVMTSRDPVPEALEAAFSETMAKVNPPTMQMLGRWLAARVAGLWDYRPRAEFESPFDPAWGTKFMEHVGWDWAAALQGCHALAATGLTALTWGQVASLVPRRVQHGYADALVGPGGRMEALRLAQGVLPAEVAKVLGALRWRLRMFGRMRAMQAEIFPDREVADRLGIDVWWYREKFRPYYAGFTEERIRRRMAALEKAATMVGSGVTVGVLEILALEW